MEKVRAVCPKCRVSIMVDSEVSALLCPKCGTTIIQRQIPQPVAADPGAVVTSGAELETKLAYAEGLLTAECYDRAEKAFRNIAILFPDDYRPHWGIVRAGTKNFTDYTGSDYAADYANAVRNAGEVSLRSMKANYGKYLEDRQKSEFERKVGSRMPVPNEKTMLPEDQAVAVWSEDSVDINTIKAEPDPPPAPPEPKRVISEAEERKLESKLKELTATRKETAKEIEDQLSKYDDLKKSHDAVEMYKVKASKPVVEWTWFLIFALLLMAAIVFVLLDKFPLWVMILVMGVLAVFMLLMLYNLLEELAFQHKLTKSRKMEEEKFNRACETYQNYVEELRGQMMNLDEEMAGIKRKLENVFE